MEAVPMQDQSPIPLPFGRPIFRDCVLLSSEGNAYSVDCVNSHHTPLFVCCVCVCFVIAEVIPFELERKFPR